MLSVNCQCQCLHQCFVIVSLFMPEKVSLSFHATVMVEEDVGVQGRCLFTLEVGVTCSKY